MGTWGWQPHKHLTNSQQIHVFHSLSTHIQFVFFAFFAMLITQFNFTAAVNCVSSINLRIRVQVHSYSYICLFVCLFVCFLGGVTFSPIWMFRSWCKSSLCLVLGGLLSCDCDIPQGNSMGGEGPRKDKPSNLILSSSVHFLRKWKLFFRVMAWEKASINAAKRIFSPLPRPEKLHKRRWPGK